jgi:hypothetical protein
MPALLCAVPGTHGSAPERRAPLCRHSCRLHSQRGRPRALAGAAVSRQDGGGVCPRAPGHVAQRRLHRGRGGWRPASPRCWFLLPPRPTSISGATPKPWSRPEPPSCWRKGSGDSRAAAGAHRPFERSARLAAMSAAARTQAHPGAAERIADRLAELAGSIKQQVRASGAGAVSVAAQAQTKSPLAEASGLCSSAELSGGN